MARPRVADRGDCLQIWRVAVNMLNKQSRTADSGWSSSLGVGRGLTTLPRKTQYLLRITTHSLGTGRITWHKLSTGKWTWDLVQGMLGAYIGQVHWIRLAQDRDWWRAVVSAVINLRVLAPWSYLVLTEILRNTKFIFLAFLLLCY
jgi:hypothetical protein